MIYCGTRAWQLAAPYEGTEAVTERVPSIVYPKHHDPAEYRWPVNGLDVLVFQGDEDIMKVNLLVIELLNQGALRVIVAHPAEEDEPVHRTVYETPSK